MHKKPIVKPFVFGIIQATIVKSIIANKKTVVDEYFNGDGEVFHNSRT